MWHRFQSFPCLQFYLFTHPSITHSHRSFHRSRVALDSFVFVRDVNESVDRSDIGLCKWSVLKLTVRVILPFSMLRGLCLCLDSWTSLGAQIWLIIKVDIHKVALDDQLSLNTLRFQRKPLQKNLITIPTFFLQITEYPSSFMNEQPKISSIASITFGNFEMFPYISNFVSQKSGCNNETEQRPDLKNLILLRTLYFCASRIEGVLWGRKGKDNTSPIHVGNSARIGIS